MLFAKSCSTKSATRWKRIILYTTKNGHYCQCLENVKFLALWNNRSERKKKRRKKLWFFCEWNRSARGWTEPTEYPNLLYNWERKSISFNKYLNIIRRKPRQDFIKARQWDRSRCEHWKKVFLGVSRYSSVVNLSRRAKFFILKRR